MDHISLSSVLGPGNRFQLPHLADLNVRGDRNLRAEGRRAAPSVGDNLWRHIRAKVLLIGCSSHCDWLQIDGNVALPLGMILVEVVPEAGTDLTPVSF